MRKVSVSVLPSLSALAVGLALAAQPAAAQTVTGARESRAGAIAKQLQQPEIQRAAGDLLAGLAEAMLQIDLSPLATAADAAGDKRAAQRLRKGGRLADVAGPGARKLPEDIRRKAPAMIAMAGGVAGAIEAMRPQLERIAEQLRGAAGRALPEADPVDPDEPPAGEATED